MSAQDDDPRLNGQERFLQGAILRWSLYTQPSETWDHDHCEFCWSRFAEQRAGYQDAQQYGFTTDDRFRWICKTCFDDFKDRFEWGVVDETDDQLKE
jgi:hypothetical protein